MTLVCLLAMVAPPAPATVILVGKSNDIARAKLTLTRRVAEDGGFTVISNLIMTPLVGPASTVREERQYDSLAQPLRATYKIQAQAVSETTVTFAGNVAKLIRDGVDEGTFEATSEPLCASMDALWFWNTKPNIGDSVTYQRFSMTTPGWKTETVTYAADETIKVASLNFFSHRVEYGGVIAHLDDRGMPVRMVVGELMLERLPQ